MKPVFRLLFSPKGRINRSRFWLGHGVQVLGSLGFLLVVVSLMSFVRDPADDAPSPDGIGSIVLIAGLAAMFVLSLWSGIR